MKFARVLRQLALLSVGWARLAAAQEVTTADAGALRISPATGTGETRLPWHDTVLVWDHSVTTQTLGIGQDYQSRNPTYEMSFRVAPRYYLVDSEVERLSARADLSLVREFTNSDVTAGRGEWTFSDAELWLSYIRTLRGSAGNRTDGVLRLPSLSLPTSNVSASNGKILGLGGGLGVDQEVTLRGASARVLPSSVLRGRVGYTYEFVETRVPTSDRVERVRLDPSGRSLPSDQLSGTAFPQHELTATLRADTSVLSELTFVTEFGVRYARRYDLGDDLEICGVVATGCVEVGSRADTTRESIATLFALELSYQVHTGILAGVAYANLASQLGPDGHRRSVFYSPEARLSASLTLVLDALYQGSTSSGAGQLAQAAQRAAY